MTKILSSIPEIDQNYTLEHFQVFMMNADT